MAKRPSVQDLIFDFMAQATPIDEPAGARAREPLREGVLPEDLPPLPGLDPSDLVRYDFPDEFPDFPSEAEDFRGLGFPGFGPETSAA